MKLFGPKRRFPYRNIVISAVVFVAFICLFWFGFGSVGEGHAKEEQQLAQSTIQKAVVNCYAIEGVYPSSLDYLEQHYGLIIDHQKFVIRYEYAGGNIRPAVEVYKK